MSEWDVSGQSEIKKSHLANGEPPEKKENCGYEMNEIHETINDGNTNIILREVMEENLKIEHEIMKRIDKEGDISCQWKSTKPPDFDGNIFNAARDGKLASIIYLLAHGTFVDSKNSCFLNLLFV